LFFKLNCSREDTTAATLHTHSYIWWYVWCTHSSRLPTPHASNWWFQSCSSRSCWEW